MDNETLNKLAHDYYSHVSSDGLGFRRKARILQSIWREEQGLAPGLHRGKPLGSRIVMPEAEEQLTNYLTENIRHLVRAEVLNREKSKGKLFAKPRIFNDLLSSQPLCFNLFGELKKNSSLASKVFRDLSNGRIDQVICIEFEWSPGRGDPKYSNDRSAFDVYVTGSTYSGGTSFIGIEVKYHENLRGSISPNPRYDEISKLMGCFDPNCRAKFSKSPLHQIWRDHLLAGIHLMEDEFDDGFFVFLYPQDNNYCINAVEDYKICLLNENTFTAWTLEQFVEVLQKHSSAEWIDQFIDRYLDFSKLEKHIT